MNNYKVEIQFVTTISAIVIAESRQEAHEKAKHGDGVKIREEHSTIRVTGLIKLEKDYLISTIRKPL